MSSKTNGRRSVLMMVSSMLIFGTIGVFRRYIPVSYAFPPCSRGMLGDLCILLVSCRNSHQCIVIVVIIRVGYLNLNNCGLIII